VLSPIKGEGSTDERLTGGVDMSQRELARKKEIDDGVQRRKKPQERAADKLKGHEETTGLKNIDAASLESHASLLSDARLSHPANAGERAQILSELQRSYGNAYVQRLLRSHALQAKLTVNPPDDVYEKEADQVAEIVTKSSGAAIQRQAEGEELEEEEEEEGAVSAKMAVSRTPEVSDDVEGRINAARGSGEALPDSVRTSLEPQFGRDFSDVRVHTGAEADALSRQLGARAFTTGQDIFFRSGDYQPESEEGKKLLGHEMTHVVQQGGAAISRQAVKTEEKAPAGEKEAEEALDKAKAKAISNMSTANIKALLYEAANCQQSNREQAAQSALDQASKEALAILKQKAKAFDVKASSLTMAKALLEQLATVQLLGAEGAEKATEAAFNKLLQWAQNQLAFAIKALQSDPSAATAQTVLEKAALVQMLGGSTAGAIAAVQKWREMEIS
jgi:hypothetical protein